MSTAKLVNVNKIYPNKVQAVFDFNLEVKDKEFIVFVGPSGCGKSTTLRMIAGLEEISSGELYIDDEFCNYTAPKDRNIAMVFQSYALYPHMTVYDNMAFGLKMKKTPKNEIKERIMEAAKILDIEQYLDRKPRELSGGQRQRVALGRAIVRNAKIFLMDEPLSNLDAKLRVEMRSAIKEIQNKIGITTVYVTHDQEEAMAVSDRIAVMNEGVIQHIGTPKDLYQRPANLFVATFIGHTNILDGDVFSEDGKTYLRIEGSFILEMDNILSDYRSENSVKVSVRPEEFIIQKDGEKGLEAVVDDCVFLGLNTHYFAHLDSGKKVEIVMESEIDSTIPKGTKISLGVKKHKINVFNQEGSKNIVSGVRNDLGE